MSHIKATNTEPEIIVRSMLHGAGYRFRIHKKDLPGKPDIVLPKYGVVIFVNGCFWHQHKGCKRASIPHSNLNYWLPKLNRNLLRYKQVTSKLRKLGWRVVTIWECQTRDKAKLRTKIDSIFNKDKPK